MNRSLLAGALAIAALCCRASIARADQPSPVVIGLDSLKIPHDNIASVAVSADGKRIYLGKRYSYDRKRRNLVVLSVGDDGQVAGAPRTYQDTLSPLPDRTFSDVTAIVPDAAHHKLYLTYSMTSGQQPKETRLLSVYDTDADGEPVGAPRSYESGNPNKSLWALARHPKLNLLYLGGWGWTSVLIYRLDDNGEPIGKPLDYPIGGEGKSQLAVSPDGARLYIGTYPDSLEIFNLDAQGLPVGKPRTFAAGNEQVYLNFSYTPQAVFLIRHTPTGAMLAAWPLGADGNPVGAPHLQPTATGVVAADGPRHKLWFAADTTFQDAFSGKTVVDGTAPASVPINDDGSLAWPAGGSKPAHREAAVAMAVSSNGRPVLVTQTIQAAFLGNRLKDDRVRLTLLDAKTADPQPPAFNLRVGPFTAPVAAATLKIGEATPWLSMDAWLKDQPGVPLLAAVTDRTDLGHLQVRIELAHGDPDNGGKVFHTMTDEVLGSNIDFLVPGYGFDPPEQRDVAVELLSEHANKYLAAAQAVGLKSEERPRLFTTSCYQIMGGQGSLKQLDTEMQTLALLGFNTSNTYWWGNIPPAKLNQELVDHDIAGRSLAVYNPPSYFDFDRKLMNPPALATWAQQQLKGSAASGGTPADVIDFKLADEPGWYYPTMLDHVRADPDILKLFRAYLAGEHLRPSDLGAASWDDVFPIGASHAAPTADITQRRLFYWTMRYFPESAAHGFKMARDALQKAGPNLKYIDVNLNNWPGIWYSASPNKKIANNPDQGPDAAMGSFDWLYAGRAGSNTPWTEDWFGDQSAQQWSLYGDLMRSEAMETGQDFGAYVIGGETGSFAGGGRLKMLALAGHGAKAFDLYTFGPELLFPGNCWSESLLSYPNIADGLRMLGRAERLLFPGRAQRGKVAILMPGCSTLWEQDQINEYYVQEIYSLHHALIDAGYTVDFVDDEDIGAGALKNRGYSVLYLTGPNVWAQAQATIRDWVRNDRGTLVALPGAAVADEYDTPTTTLDEVLGVQAGSRRQVREAAPQPSLDLPVTDTLLVSDPRFGSGEIALRGPVQALVPAAQNGAASLARLKSGGAGITAGRYGNGRTVAYAFYPGWQYWVTPDRSDATRLPQGWGQEQLKLATEPAVLADTPRPVKVSQLGVEACRLQSAQGIAVVLLNWTGQPIPSLQVEVSDASKFHRVTSLDHGSVAAEVEAGNLKLELPLDVADVIMIEP